MLQPYKYGACRSPTLFNCFNVLNLVEHKGDNLRWSRECKKRCLFPPCFKYSNKVWFWWRHSCRCWGPWRTSPLQSNHFGYLLIPFVSFRLILQFSCSCMYENHWGGRNGDMYGWIDCASSVSLCAFTLMPRHLSLLH